VRYTLGHTLASILTLESVYIQNHGRNCKYEDARLSISDAPLSRQLTNSLRVLYAHRGPHILTKGLYTAAIYQLSKTTMISMLTATVLRPAMVHPIADIVASVLLVEGHMHWTHATISSGKSSLGVRLWTHDRNRWKKLVLPCLAQGCAVALLDWISRSLPDMSGASNSDVSRTLSAIAVLRVFTALFVRSFVLAPTSAWLMIVETSCLDSGEETMVYAREKGRFVSVSTLFAGLELRGSVELWKGVSLRLCLWLLELHVKKCAVQMALEGFVSSTVRLVS
jgi:hypothetical protein